MDVTLETVRRVHGGAILADAAGFEPALGVRESVRVEKAWIAEAALDWLPEEGDVAIAGDYTSPGWTGSCPSTAR